MLIPVIYKNGKSGAVEASQLEALIQHDKIKKFLRMSGWAVVGKTPLRGMGGKHDGSRRRKAEHRAKVLAGTHRKRPADSAEEELISFEIEDDGTTTELKLTKNRHRSRSRRR